MKIIKTGTTLLVVLKGGRTLVKENCDEALFNEVLKLSDQDNEEGILSLLSPKEIEIKEEIEKVVSSLREIASKSQYLEVFGESVFIPSISEYTLPENLAREIFKAEQEGDQDKLTAYLNFWTLVSLNPDSRARVNLFWFLTKYGMTISQSGAFVAFRNAEVKQENVGKRIEDAHFITGQYIRVKTKLKKAPKNYVIGMRKGEKVCIAINSAGYKDPEFSLLGNLQELYDALSTQKEKEVVFTDKYTKSFTIRIGEMVQVPRESCDPDSDVTCSNGLHVAGEGWLSKNYFGTVSLMVLVNPADVVAIPHQDSYGKMRVCAYLPIAVVEINNKGEIEGKIETSGFEDDLIGKLNYALEEGVKVDKTDHLSYTFHVPSTPELHKQKILANLKKIKDQTEKRFLVRENN